MTRMPRFELWVAAGSALRIEGKEQELRILGDERRGYLLAGGLRRASHSDEFWFETLAEALDAAEALGVRRDAWTTLDDGDLA